MVQTRGPDSPQCLTLDVGSQYVVEHMFKNITLYLSAVVCGRKSDSVEMGHWDV